MPHVRLAFLWICLLLVPTAFAQQPDSLINAFNTTTESEAKAKLALKISDEYFASSPERMVAWARAGYDLVRTMDVPVRINLGNFIAIYHKDRGAFDSAFYYYNEGLAAAKRMGYAKGITNMRANIGQLYGMKGQYAQALKYQLPALSWYELNGPEINKRITTMAVGNTYHFMKDDRRALQYFNRIYPAVKDEQNQFVASLFNNMALSYNALGDHVKESELLRRSLVIKEKLGDSLGISRTLNNLGQAAVSQKDYNTAENYFTEAVRIAEALGNKQLASEHRQNLALIMAKRGNGVAAAKRYEAALAEAKAAGDLRLQKITLENLIALHDTLHDYSAAYRYMAAYEALSNTSRSRTYVKEIADAETKYETQKALRERERANYESSLQAAAKKRALRERNTAIGIGAGALVALVLIFALAWRIRAIRSRTREEQGLTRAIFEGEQAERIRIARDLHDSIGQMLSVVRMRLSVLPDLPAPEMAESAGISMQLLDKTLSEVRTISHNLIPDELAAGIVRAIENLCAKISRAGSVQVKLTIADAVRARKFSEQFGLSLYRIVQEVLGNMLKHSGATEIRVEMSETAGLIILQLADNGRGFDTNSIPSSRGIGWKNIFARVNLLNGSVDVRSERISGTRIEITVPQ